jgi:hypothetical protein
MMSAVVQGYCPCEETCSNQMFSKRQYAQLDKVRSWVGCLLLAATC